MNANWQLCATIYDSRHFAKAWKAKKEYTPETATAESHIPIRSAIPERLLTLYEWMVYRLYQKEEVSQCKHTASNVVPREKCGMLGP